jgi:HAE1 family hydrophobic/amphiphilic exporter-1
MAWSTFVISLSLPVSMIATFFFMGQFDLSLNVMSLSGLALATGLVVDDSIVVLESIAKARERGLGVLQAAISGTREVGMAVVASTLTNVAVFLPLVFVQGVAGQLFKRPGADRVGRHPDVAGGLADPDSRCCQR